MVKIMCDSACDLTPELIEKYNISVIPCHVLLRESDYLDGINIVPSDIFSFVEKEGILPKTAAPSISEIADLFRKELETSDEIVSIAMSSHISGTCNFMRLAAEETGEEDRITVIDSENLSTAFGFIVMKAAEKAQEGWNACEIKAYTEEVLKKRINISFVVDGLKYLYMGGRCTALEAFAGSSLKLHPLIHMEDGSLHVKKKYMGSIETCLSKYTKEMEAELMTADPEMVILTYATTPDSPSLLKAYEVLKAMNYFKEILLVPAGSLICSHCGPGAMGIACMKQSET